MSANLFIILLHIYYPSNNFTQGHSYWNTFSLLLNSKENLSSKSPLLNVTIYLIVTYFRDFQSIARFKTRENLFLTFLTCLFSCFKVRNRMKYARLIFAN